MKLSIEAWPLAGGTRTGSTRAADVILCWQDGACVSLTRLALAILCGVAAVHHIATDLIGRGGGGGRGRQRGRAAEMSRPRNWGTGRQRAVPADDAHARRAWAQQTAAAGEPQRSPPLFIATPRHAAPDLRAPGSARAQLVRTCTA